MSDDSDPGRARFSRDGKRCPAAAPRARQSKQNFQVCDRFARATHTKEVVVTYLIVGLDIKTHVPWHENVSADDVGTATRIARTRAAAQGIDLVVAALIGPNSAVVPDSPADWAAGLKAA